MTTRRTALVTGVSRRQGTGFATARRLLAHGSRVFAHSWSAYDATEPWGADPAGVGGVVGALEAAVADVQADAQAAPRRAPGGVSEAVPGGHLRAARNRLAHAEVDLADPDAPRRLLRMATDRFGPVDALIANHARSSSYPLAGVTAAELDAAGR